VKGLKGGRKEAKKGRRKRVVGRTEGSDDRIRDREKKNNEGKKVKITGRGETRNLQGKGEIP